MEICKDCISSLATDRASGGSLKNRITPTIGSFFLHKKEILGMSS